MNRTSPHKDPLSDAKTVANTGLQESGIQDSGLQQTGLQDSGLQLSKNETPSGQQRRQNANGSGAQAVRSPTPPGGKQTVPGKGGNQGKGGNSGQVLSGKKHAKNGPG